MKQAHRLLNADHVHVWKDFRDDSGICSHSHTSQWLVPPVRTIKYQRMIEPTQQRAQDKDQRTNPKYFDFPTAIANFTKQQQTRTDNHQINGHTHSA